MSSFGIFLILFGGFLMAVGYAFVSQCSSMYSSSYCWEPFVRGVPPGALGLYIGATFAAIGVIILASGPVARLMRKS